MNRVIFRCTKMFLLLLVLLGGIETIEANDGHIPLACGFIFDSSGTSIEGGYIHLLDLGRLFSSDKDGFYTVEGIPEGYYSVDISATGYITQEDEILVNDHWPQYDYYLVPTLQQLPDLSVSWNDISFEKVD